MAKDIKRGERLMERASGDRWCKLDPSFGRSDGTLIQELLAAIANCHPQGLELPR